MANRLEGVTFDKPATPSPGSSVTMSPAPAPVTDSNRLGNVTFDKPAAPKPSIAEPVNTGNSFWFDLIHPQTADLSRPQTWRDWATKTYYPTAQDVGSAAFDDVSMGTADYAQSKLGGGNIDEIRARTAASQAALGPMGPIINAATYVAGPGKVLGPLAAIGKGAKVAVKAGRAAVEGGAAGAVGSVGHQLGHDIDPTQVAEDAAKSAAFGVGGNWAGRTVLPAVGRVADYVGVTGAPGRAGDPLFGPERALSAAGEDIRPDIRALQQSLPPTPAADVYRRGLEDVHTAANFGYGPMGDAARTAARTGGRAAAYKFAPWSLFFGDPGRATQGLADKGMDYLRNQRVQNAFDQVHAAAGRPLYTDTSGWADALRQATIGTSLP